MADCQLALGSEADTQRADAIGPQDAILPHTAPANAILNGTVDRRIPDARMTKARKSDIGEEHLRRVRRICSAMPETTEKLSHGEPTFFVRKKVFAMFANNHHSDGHIAVWIPAPPGLQAMLIAASPETFFKPPYVGMRGWVGIELDTISDEELAAHILDAWRLVAPKKSRYPPDARSM